MTVTTLSTEFGGRTLTIETGKLARLAGGSVTVQYGDTVLLGTANRADPRPGLDFFPLTIDFEERMYAAGKIPGGFIKREARPSEAAILAARLTDRPIRPLFPQGYKDDVQCVLTVLSTDQENNPDVIGTVAASAALTISEIPFLGPVAAARVGRIGGELVINPTASQMEARPRVRTISPKSTSASQQRRARQLTTHAPAAKPATSVIVLTMDPSAQLPNCPNPKPAKLPIRLRNTDTTMITQAVPVKVVSFSTSAYTPSRNVIAPMMRFISIVRPPL